MSEEEPPQKSGGKCPFHMLSRRSFLKGAGGLGLFAAAAGLGALGEKVGGGNLLSSAKDKIIPFHSDTGEQAGIRSNQQQHTYFASFDIITDKRDDVIKLLKSWTEAAAKLAGGQTIASDGDEAANTSPARLTLTFGFGPSFFNKDSKDRFGLSGQRPVALVDLPKFNGDQLIPEKTGGDLSVQACADDPQVVFNAVRKLVTLASDVANVRWVQTGFLTDAGEGETPRNLQGFKDGTQNPIADDQTKYVWVGNEGPKWMQGGSYLVTRRIRIALEHWDNTPVDFQEQVIGRHKNSGAPLGGKTEYTPLNLEATDKDGNFIIPDNAHVRLGHFTTNDGAQILRRSYSYNDGVNFVAERWPPWRQGVEYDAGLLFIAYQRDPRNGFIKIFNKMSKLDALNQFTTHTGGGLFACPPGAKPGEYIGQRLFETV